MPSKRKGELGGPVLGPAAAAGSDSAASGSLEAKPAAPAAAPQPAAAKELERAREEAAAATRRAYEEARALLKRGQYEAAFECLKARPETEHTTAHGLYQVLERILDFKRRAGLAGQAGFAYSKELELISGLSAIGLHEEALGLITPPLLSKAAGSEADAKIVACAIRVAEKIGRDWLLARLEHCSSGVIPAYVKAFSELRAHEMVLDLLARKPRYNTDDFEPYVAALKALGRLKQARWERVMVAELPRFAQVLLEAGADKQALACLLRDRGGLERDGYAVAFRACLRLGDFKAAEGLYQELQESLTLKEAPELYYFYALICEKAGRIKPARAVYQRLAKRFVDYKDVKVRLVNLASITAREMARLTETLKAPGVAAGPTSAPAAIVANKFEIHKSLGMGGMGVVYKGWDRALSRPVAIKQMRDEIARDSRAREAFIAEARVVAALTHPNIVAIHEIVTEGDEVYLIFEFVDGEDLYQMVSSRGRLKPKECAYIMYYVCEAMAHAHAKGVVHRDLKPANIMWGRAGHIKVMDFGLATQAGEAGVAGTRCYMAPEQHEGQVCVQSDIYALGETLYEMLTGEVPFKGNDVETLKALKAKMEYRPASQVVEGLPAAWDEAIGRCLQADKGKRFESAKDFLAAVGQAAG